MRKFGALGVHVMATHGLFSGNSISILNEHRDFIQKIVISNTVPVSDEVEEQLGDLLFTIDISGKSLQLLSISVSGPKSE